MEISVCTDCVMLIANGELGQGDEAADQQHAELIVAQGWKPGDLALGDGEPYFSNSWCRGCGSTLAGDRYEAYYIEPETPTSPIILATDTEVVLTREAYDAALEGLDALARWVQENVGPEAQLLYRVGQVEAILGK